ncbi:ChaN family lipoprotein [Hwanghaeella grinnelliae]|nr:ChaN family lipoprotein [Hwanghaeella grinnelliae]
MKRVFGRLPRSILPPICLAATLAVPLAIAGCTTSTVPDAQAASNACAKVGQWVDPATKRTLDARALLADLAGKDVVLLGEQHTTKDHHVWQTQTIAALQALNPDIVLGFEMFPRSVQPALDAWISGATTRQEFLKQSRWSEVWGYPPELYMPMFEQARLNRNPMVALNVARTLIAKVGREGWASVAADDREGVTDPAPASFAYRESLAEVFLAKLQHGHSRGDSASDSPAPSLESIMKSEPFANFVQAQVTWDRAMAEALATAKNDNPNALIIGVMGRGHIDYRHGVPHQLSDLGIDNVAVLIPLEAGEDCAAAQPGLADAVFTVDPPAQAEAEKPKPRLGVVIEPVDQGDAGDQGIRIVQVTPNSIAEAAGLFTDDIIVTAAGTQVRQVRDLVEIIQRQAPGTWLPLEIRRGGETLSVVAKFPPLAGADQ